MPIKLPNPQPRTDHMGGGGGLSLAASAAYLQPRIVRLWALSVHRLCWRINARTQKWNQDPLNNIGENGNRLADDPRGVFEGAVCDLLQPLRVILVRVRSKPLPYKVFI